MSCLIIFQFLHKEFFETEFVVQSNGDKEHLGTTSHMFRLNSHNLPHPNAHEMNKIEECDFHQHKIKLPHSFKVV